MSFTAFNMMLWPALYLLVMVFLSSTTEPVSGFVDDMNTDFPALPTDWLTQGAAFAYDSIETVFIRAYGFFALIIMARTFDWEFTLLGNTYNILLIDELAMVNLIAGFCLALGVIMTFKDTIVKLIDAVIPL